LTYVLEVDGRNVGHGLAVEIGDVSDGVDGLVVSALGGEPFLQKRGRLSCRNELISAKRRETHRRLGKGEDEDSNDPAEEDKTTEGVH
jgi:hypothetical protein